MCCILGPLSLNVTLGGHPWVPDSGLTRLISTPPPPPHTHPFGGARALPPPPPRQPSPRRGVPGRVQSSATASCPNPGAGLALRGCGRRASAGTALLCRAGDRPALPASPGSRQTAGLSLGAPALARRAWKTPARSTAQKVDSSPNSPGSWSAESRGAAGRSSPPQPRPGSGSHTACPPHPPTPGKQRARAQSPPGRRRSGEAAACAVDPAGGAHCGDGPRDAPDSHLLLLLPPLPAGLPVAWDHLRYVLE